MIKQLSLPSQLRKLDINIHDIIHIIIGVIKADERSEKQRLRNTVVLLKRGGTLRECDLSFLIRDTL